MYRLFSKIAVFTSVLVLTAHTLFPHSHEAESELIAVEEATIFHLLSHIFEQDLGEGHLENYLSVGISSIPGPSFEMVLQENSILIERHYSTLNQLSSFKKGYYKQVEPLSSGPPRSPPVA